MKQNAIKATLQAGGSVLGTCVSDCFNPEIVVAIQAAGLDFFFIDSEHARTSFDDVQAFVRVAKSADVVPLVRVPQSEYFFLARMLDVGAMGIINPRTESVEEVRKIVGAMKFPPHGRRGYGLRSIVTDLDFKGAAAEMESANRESMVIIQMETQSCVDNIEEMVAVEGVDATMVGPFDLSVSLGIPGEFEHPKFWAAFDRMVKACNEVGVAPGVHFGNTKMLQRARNHGARFLVCGTDMSVLLNGFRSIRTDMEAAVPEAAGKAGGYM
jgi:2-dehydro-3-deoxyglucarate aldolase/4-hydroxy-2-oxoheptanedioate aldolase